MGRSLSYSFHRIPYILRKHILIDFMHNLLINVYTCPRFFCSYALRVYCIDLPQHINIVPY